MREGSSISHHLKRDTVCIYGFTQNFVYQSKIGPINILKCHIFHGESIPSPTLKGDRKFSGLISKKQQTTNLLMETTAKRRKKKLIN